MSIDINGIAHLRINVTNFKAAKIFYKKLFDFFKMTIIFESDDVIYAVGGRTGLCVSRVQEGNLKNFNQNNVGLHHFCFRARSSSDVDLCYEFLKSINAKIVKSPSHGPWAKDYYFILFEDPDGIRLEVNYVPGKGNLEPGLNKSMHNPTLE